MPAARRLHQRVFWLCALAPVATVAWASAHASSVLDGRVVEEHVDWVPALGLGLTLRLDGFSLLMLALLSGVGVLVFAYSTRYFAWQPGLGRFAAFLTAFSGSMLGFVLADTLLCGAALRVEARGAAAKLLLVVALQFVTAPVGAHMVGRAAYRAGTELSPETSVDELAEARAGEDAGERTGPAVGPGQDLT